MKWTKDKDEIVITSIKEGKNYNEISIKLNISPNAVRSRCFRLGIKIYNYNTIKTQICKYCGKKIKDKRERKFCSQKCSAIYNNKNKTKRPNGICLNCGKERKRNSYKYCSNECQFEYQYKEYIKRWKNGEENGMSGPDNISAHIRNYMFNKHDNKCSKCEWSIVNEYTNKIPLEIDHIDGDHTNNKEKNLRLLCPNCHSLTSNYGSRNKGKGREYRRLKRKNTPMV